MGTPHFQIEASFRLIEVKYLTALPKLLDVRMNQYGFFILPSFSE